jgi:hypothetical protein
LTEENENELSENVQEDTEEEIQTEEVVDANESAKAPQMNKGDHHVFLVLLIVEIKARTYSCRKNRA